MTGADVVRVSSITKVWVGLGGDEPRRGRARAFYRDGKNPQAVSLNEEKSCWYDHRDSIGGGILNLIQRVLGCDRGAALRWLADFNAVPLDNRPFSAAERRLYGRRRAQAEQLARDVADFEHGLELFLRRRRDDVAALTEWLLKLGVESGELLLDIVRELAILREVDPDSLVATYRELPESVRGRFRDAGRRDRENAEAVTQEIVSMLAQGARTEAAA